MNTEFKEYITSCIEAFNARKALVGALTNPDIEFSELESLRVGIAIKKGRQLKTLVSQLKLMLIKWSDSPVSMKIPSHDHCEKCRCIKSGMVTKKVGDKINFTMARQAAFNVSYSSCDGVIFGFYPEANKVRILYLGKTYSKDINNVTVGLSDLTVSFSPKKCKCEEA